MSKRLRVGTPLEASAALIRATRGLVRRSKYHAIPTYVEGLRFASKAEARRFGELKLMEKAGEIWDLELQPRFPLCGPSTSGQLGQALKVAAGTFDGKIGEYRADFQYHDKTGLVVEDVKGMATLPLAKWKIRHVEKQYHIKVREVRYR